MVDSFLCPKKPIVGLGPPSFAKTKTRVVCDCISFDVSKTLDPLCRFFRFFRFFSLIHLSNRLNPGTVAWV